MGKWVVVERPGWVMRVEERVEGGEEGDGRGSVCLSGLVHITVRCVHILLFVVYIIVVWIWVLRKSCSLLPCTYVILLS